MAVLELQAQNVEIEIEYIADRLSEASAEEQADFFNRLGLRMREWGRGDRDSQIMSIEEELTPDAKFMLLFFADTIDNLRIERSQTVAKVEILDLVLNRIDGVSAIASERIQKLKKLIEDRAAGA